MREETLSPPRTFSEVSFLLRTMKEHNYSPFATPGETQGKQKSNHDILYLSDTSFCSKKIKQNFKAFMVIANVYEP